MKKSKAYFEYVIITLFSYFLLNSDLIAQCPSITDILNRGWNFSGIPGNIHNPDRSNHDEFGIINSSPFYVKVLNYPPLRSFPITSTCTQDIIYYMSFDTENSPQDNPLPISLPYHNLHEIKFFNSNGNGKRLSIYPPGDYDIGNPGIPDFLMTYEGVKHAVGWNESEYPDWEWGDFVTTPQNYSTTFQVQIDGLSELNYYQTSEYIANINGGHGNYGISWKYRELPSGGWIIIKNNAYAENYFNIVINNVTETIYFYEDEYKADITMGENDIELEVSIADNETYVVVYDVITIHRAPAQITFINEIESTTNFGELILDEDKEIPIQSGIPKSINYGANFHTIRTDELPFIYNYNNTGNTEKHIYFELGSPSNINNVLNHSFQVTLNTPSIIKSKFIRTDPVIIKNQMEGSEISGSILHFKDPWYYYHDTYYNWFQSDEFKQYSSPLNLLNNSTSSYGGVFLNQGLPDWSPPYYSAKVDLEQPILLGSDYHEFYFQSWSYDPAKISLQYPSSNQTGVVFTSSEQTTLTANLKGQLVSSESNGFSSNGQRKIVRDNSGYYHCVYSSLGKVWYTKSTTSNFTGNWTQDAEIFAGIVSKNPSMDVKDDNFAVVAELQDGNEAAVYLYRNDSSPIFEVALIDNSYYGSSYPVISKTNNELFIVYKTSASSPLKYRCYYKDNDYPYDWIWTPEADLPYSTSNSKYPSIVGDKSSDDVYIVWQEGASEIKYLYSHRQDDNRTFDSADFQSVSGNCGYTYNANPSISLSYTDIVVVSWTGGRKESVLNKVLGKETSLAYVYRALIRVKASSWGNATVLGSGVNFTNNNSSTSSSGETVIAFSQSNGQTSKWIKRVGAYYSELGTLSHNGLQVNVSNGTGLVNQKALVFNTSSLPYAINRSTTSFTQFAKIVSDTSITYGRTGIVGKQGMEFLFCAEDILLDDENIKFTERVDTLPVLNLNELNSIARTNTFNLTGNSNLYFSLYYLVINPELASSLLTDEDYVNFKLELVNADNNYVAGTFDDITFTKQNVYDYENISYKIDCAGIEEGSYYLRIAADANSSTGLSITNNQNDAGELGKRQYVEIYYTGNTTPTEYDLAQNFPNPFNPSTTIHYQIPQDGIVTLKIYDILGSEVATLINEEKVAGKYEANFNASSFASGVYIYKLQAGDFVNSKKMILLK